MKIEFILALHLCCLSVAAVVVALFPLPTAAIANLADLAKGAEDVGPVFTLRAILYFSAVFCVIALAPIIRARGVDNINIDGIRNIRNIKWNKLLGANLLIAMVSVGFLLEPVSPPSWLNYSIFYFVGTLAIMFVNQMLIQYNFYVTVQPE